MSRLHRPKGQGGGGGTVGRERRTDNRVGESRGRVDTQGSLPDPDGVSRRIRVPVRDVDGLSLVNYLRTIDRGLP